ncbi:MAG: HEAT repeat domain-containing protein [Gemmatimonadales bacterium]|jgi:HEAT repeat protein
MTPSLGTLEIVLEVVAIQALALAVLFFVRRISAATQHRLLSIAVLAVIVVTVASPFVPARRLGLFPVEDVGARPERAVPWQPEAEPRIDAPVVPESEGLVGATQPAAPSTQTAMPRSAPTIAATLGMIWAAGSALVLLWVLLGMVYGWWLSRRTRRAESARLTDRFRWALEQVGLHPDIPLVESERLKIPVVFGWLKPRVILPAHANDWSEDRLRAVLLHESAHIRRRDLVHQFLAKLTCAVYWFNPLAWIVERKLFLAGERAADDQVIRRDVSAADYAEHLMETSEELGVERTPIWATAAMAEGTAFKDRILSILDPNVQRGEPDMSDRTVVALAAAAVIVSVVALSPWRAASSAMEAVPPPSMAVDTPPPAAVQSAVVADQPRQDVQDDFATLVAMLRMRDASMREHAAEALGRLGDQRAVEPLMNVVLNDADASVREHACTALGLLGDSRAVDVLSRAAQSDPSARVREHAASALSQLGDVEAVPSLIDAVVNDRDAAVREHAATALGGLGDPSAVPALIDAVLHDRSAEVREHAATALGQLGDRRARDPLVRVGRTDPDPEVREHAVVALGQVGDLSAFDFLLETMHGIDVEEVRAHAAYALGLLGDERALEPLLAALRDSSARMRANAAQGLGELGDARALDALRRAQNDRDEMVRHWAGEAIAMIRGRR